MVKFNRVVKFLGENAVIQKSAPASPAARRSITDLQSDISGDGDVDLAGQEYSMQAEDVFDEDNDTPGILSIPNNKRIQNAVINFGYYPSDLGEWTDEGSGVFSAPLHEFGEKSVWSSGLGFIVDDAQSSQPLVNLRPNPPVAMNEYRMSFNPNFLTVIAKGDSSPVNSVQTEGGDNIEGELITGFTVHDVSLRSTINAIIGTSIDESDGISCVIYSDKNNTDATVITSWNARGVMEFKSSPLKFEGYMSVAFTGMSGDLNSGEYAINLSSSGRKIYYRPVNGSPIGAVIPGSARGSRQDFTGVAFENCTFTGIMTTEDSQASLFVHAVGGTISFSNCEFKRVYWVVQGGNFPANIDSCTSDYSIKRLFLIGDGSTVTNCVFGPAAHSSTIRTGWNESSPPSPPNETVIRNNIISCFASTHGQALSLYSGSWQNATVEGNIFLNSERSIAISGRGQTATAGTLTIRNNIFLIDDIPLDLSNGQKGVAVNSLPDSLYDEYAQNVRILNNTSYATDQARAGETVNGSYEFPCAFEINDFRTSDVVVQNNILSSLNASQESSDPTQVRKRHAHFNNAHWKSLFGDSYGVDCYGANGDVEITLDGSLISNTSLETQGDWTTFATDQGAIGIRWSSIPSVAQINTWFDDRETSWFSGNSLGIVPDIEQSAQEAENGSDDDYLVYQSDDKRPIA